jgi:hypothetical protein
MHVKAWSNRRRLHAHLLRSTCVSIPCWCIARRWTTLALCWLQLWWKVEPDAHFQNLARQYGRRLCLIVLDVGVFCCNVTRCFMKKKISSSCRPHVRRTVTDFC